MRIVSITSRTSEIICALGAGDRIVGRDSYSIVPSSLEDVPVVAGSSYTPNVELILELEPDLVIDDSMLSDDYRQRIEDAGIPVIVETSWDPATVDGVVSHLGIVLDEEDRAGEIIGFIEQYHDIVEERCADLKEEEKPAVFFEWSQPYHSGASGTLFHNLTVASGGINVVADETAKYPTVSPEWLAERDPDIILRLVSSTEDLTEEMMVEARDEILSRPGLISVKAVEDDRAYILSSPVTTGVRSIIGELYLAKWFHPDHFEDIDPEEVHEELVQQFFGQELEGVYVYP
ncbi:MAG TPA: ABC transporter substrate-binding protein [Methanothrix sp.]|nr:ABC transporter substrate-binding protein [Methanothrix sp.]